MRIVRLSCILAALAAIGLSGAGCRKAAPAPAQRPNPTVTVSQPVAHEIVEWDEYPGWLEATEMVEVRARVNGYLQSIHFQDGAEVKKGDLLFVIDPRPYQAELDRAQADLHQMQTRLELAYSELERAEKLLQSKAISVEEADTRRKTKREVEAGIQSAKAMAELAKINLDYTRITSPITGRIGRKLITEGNLVNGGGQGGSTLLTTIVSLDPIYCYFNAEEPAVLKYQQLLREGKWNGKEKGKIPCEVGLANEKGFPHGGVVDFINNQVDPNTGTLRIRGVLANPDRILQPGFFARVRVPGSEKYRALQVPDQAIGTDQGQKFVYVVNDKNTVEYRKVTLGPSIDGLRVIRDGLEGTEWVVVNGLMSVRPGAPVNPSKAAAEAEKAPTQTTAAQK